eukprot:TRINITY_DN1709_c0_g1_i2.p1 TRINITY_DN1709_c0_g1~~TRINITY_DN1709_c0_g1_i2.p1  ORF type:complete len:149 (-),score=26.17 TRINITY_DN1709_c0_g1_i2:139-585(-)
MAQGVKIAQYEKLIDEKLKVELKNTLDQRDKLFDQISKYVALRNNINLIQQNNLKSLDSMVNLGSEFYAKAEVPDTSKIFVNIGLGFHVELNLSEAIGVIEAREKLLTDMATDLTNKAAQIKGHIKLVCLAINELMNLPMPEKPRRVF